nr:IPT/TIG domain-containing protein [Caulobacter mirabilis]
MRLTGGNFTGVNRVLFGAKPAASFTVESDTQITATSPSGTGTVDIVVRNTHGQNTSPWSATFVYLPKPVVSGLSQSSGPAGTVLTISGGNFGNAPVVKFGGVQAAVIGNTYPWALTVRVPNGSGQVHVTVQGPGGVSATSAASLFTYDGGPVINNLAPAKGSVLGGTTVQVNGLAFTGATAVTFGGVPATSFTVDSGGRITAVAPAGAAGDVDVVVTTPSGSSAGKAFTYVGLPTISSIQPNGSELRINGSALADTTSVTFGGAPAVVRVSDAYNIYLTPPAGVPGQSVDVVITTIMGTSTPDARSRYTYPGLPVVTSVSPHVALSGASVTIAGAYLADVTAVRFGALDAAIVSRTATSLTITAPAGVTGETVDVQVTNGAGQSAITSGSRFTYAGVPTVTAISPATGPAAGGTPITIDGTGFSSNAKVAFTDHLTAYATNVVVVSPTRITAVSPAGRGRVNVRVITHDDTSAGGTSAISSASVFNYVGGSLVESVNPGSGPATGGTTVRINGRDFLPESTVTFGDKPAASVTYVSPTLLEAVSPPGSNGSVSVYVNTNGYTGPTIGTFTYQGGAPTLTNVSPPRGAVAGDTYVNLSGFGFSAVTQVLFGDVSVPFRSVHDTLILLNSPPGRQGDVVEVKVVSANGASAPGAGTRFAFGEPPAISSFTPAFSYPEGGAKITITGANFTGATGVKFGDTPATSFTVLSDTQITAVAPAGTVNDGTKLRYLTVESPTGSGRSQFWFNYLDPITIETKTVAAGVAGRPYRQDIKLSPPLGSTNQILNGVLPAGLSINGNGAPIRIEGTPKEAGVFSFTVKSTVDYGRVATQDYTLEIAKPTLALALATLSDVVQGVAYSQTLIATGGVAPYSFAVTAGALPDGLSLDARTGVLSGTPASFGPYSFTVTASDSTGGTGPASIQRLYEGVVEGIRPVAADRVETADYDQPTAMDMTFSVSGQTPTGVEIVTQSAHGVASVSGMVITYTPTKGYVGADTFTYTASGGGKLSNVATVSVRVNAPDLRIIPVLPNEMRQAVPYAGVLTVTGGAAPYTFSVMSGALPTGLTLSPDGAITGVPTASGSFSFTVKAVDASTGLGAWTQASYSFTVGVPPAPVAEPKEVTVDIKPTPNGGGSAEIDLSTSVQYASGIQITRQPSHGTLTVDGFKVTYTPTPGYFGQDSFDYVAVPIANNPRARTARAAAAGATVTLTIPAPTLVFGQTTLPNGEEKVAYSQTLTASGGTAPYRFVVTTGALPAGLTLSPAGVLSGVPTVGGSFGFTVTATDSSTGTGPFSVAQAFTLSLKAAVPQLAAPIEASTIQGREVVVDLTAGARGGPFTAAAVVSVTPAGAGEAKIVETGTAAARGYSLAFKSSGTFSGSATVIYTLSNASGVSAPGVVTVKVEARPDPSQDPDVRGIVTAQADAALRMAETQIGNFGRRMESLHSGGSRRFQQGITLGFGFADGGLVDPWTQREIDMNRRFDFSPQAMADIAAADPTKGLAHPRGLMAGGGTGGGGASGSGVAGEGQVSIWTGGSIQFGRRDAKNGGPKFDFTTGGLSLGADLRLSERLAIGVGGGFGQSTADVGSRGSSVEASNYFGVLYASLQPVDGAFIDGMIGYGKLDFDTRRKVSAGVLTPTDVYAVGSRSGDQLILSVSAGWDFRRGDLFISPYARVSSITGTLDAYVERGAGAGNLRYEDQDLSSLKIALGARGERTFKTDLGLLTPRFRVEYQRELKDSELAKLSYDDWVGGPLFSVLADPFERDQWLIGIGGELRRNRSKFSLDYQGNLSSGRDFVSELTGQISFEF